ncbi:LamG-like jellyroll fold domain-containing protein [Streptomyces sp. NPDC001876]|uniref:LamG-like jellyroll fold domain-containing protein n=1 Tax=Streptomyces sp. NPDC001876 TaxID=3154402 RepID=UPI0033288DCC
MPILVEMGWGGLVQYPWSITWTDITPRVDMVQGVTITRGASDERGETQPGSATLTFDNQDGALTPGNPNSDYHPYVRRNAPIRVSMAVIPTRAGAAPWPLAHLADDFDDGRTDSTLWPNCYGGTSETNGRARVPVTPGVVAGYQTARQWTLTGSKITAKLAQVPAVNGSSAASASMWINSTTSGTRIGWSYSPVTGLLRAASEVAFSDGAATTVTYSAIDHAWLRIRETSGSVVWETSGDGWAWTVRRTLATPAWIGAQTQAVDFSATRTGGVADFVEWDLVGAEVRPRFWGVVNEWPVQWKGLLSSVSVSATDLFKRLNKLPTLRSMLGMEVMTRDTLTGIYSFLAAYYPLTEDTGAAAAGSVAGSSVGALAVTQVSAGGTAEFGTEGVPETGETAVTLTPASASAGKYLVGDLGPQTAEDTTTWVPHIQVWFKTSTVSRVICGLHDPVLDHQLVFLLNGSGVLAIESTETGEALVTATSASANLANNAWHHLVYDGSTKRLYIDGAAVGGSLLVSGQADLRTLYVGGYRGARLFSGQIGHVSLHLATGSAGAVYATTYDAISGFAPESADWRVERLARYAGLQSVTIHGSTHDMVASQGPGGTGVVARLREIEATESARLYAERDYYGLAYQSRDVRYNPDPLDEVFTIDYADLDTLDVQLADDDQKLVNEVEASRPGGATQTVTAPSSILAFGSYPQQLNILKTSDLSVMDAAYWLVSRYANPDPELREVPVEAYTMPDYVDILDADISSYFTVYNLPSQAPATSLRVTVEGYTETIKENSHVIQFRTSASNRDSVWILGDSVYGVLDTTTRLAY